ncbi:cytochrome-c peroxidase [Pseudoalteromonas sp.]|uniref:cytochrome-c peroxidase n=1 Tax=Pseudoalteromonas sp. TaxID=53249 RepID=UPI003569A39C
MRLIFINTLLLVTVWSTLAHAEPVDFSDLRKQYLKPQPQWPKAHLDADIEFAEITRLPAVTFPQDNPYSTAKMRLGEQLFNDPKLSRSGQVACASCHDRDLGWADGRKLSFGHDRLTGKRNAPSIENAAFWQSLFWDGRAQSLEQQSLMPVEDPVEMNFTLTELEARLNKNTDYQKKFRQVFASSPITAEQIAQALATYQRTIVSRNSAFDYFVKAGTTKDKKLQQQLQQKLSDQALWGLHLFRTKARCINCHSGALFSDNKFHNLGLTYYQREREDLGRYNVTKNPNDVGKFKTPSLRNVMNSKPWMHNGVFPSIAGILNIYNAGGFVFNKDPNDPLSPQTSKILQPLSLTAAEKHALRAFLQAISSAPATGPDARFIVRERNES